jgi:hypothetical protein
MRQHPLTGVEYLTVDDVDELPNGTSSIIKMRKADTMEVRKAVVDKEGWLRSFDEARAFFGCEWDAVNGQT